MDNAAHTGQFMMMLVAESLLCSEFPIYCSGTIKESASFGCAWRLGAWLPSVASATGLWDLFGGSRRERSNYNTLETDWSKYFFYRRATQNYQERSLIKGAHGAITGKESLNVLSFISKAMMEPNRVKYVAEISLAWLLKLPLLTNIKPFLSNLWAAVMLKLDYRIVLCIRLSVLDLITFKEIKTVEAGRAPTP